MVKMAAISVTLQFLLKFTKCTPTTKDFEYPSNEYEYSIKRDWLLKEEQLYAKQDIQLTEVCKINITKIE